MDPRWLASAQPEKRAHPFQKADQANRGGHKEVRLSEPADIDDADMVLAGHGRLEAARLEGLTQVPVIRFDHLTAAQTRAYVIADNKLAEEAGGGRGPPGWVLC